MTNQDLQLRVAEKCGFSGFTVADTDDINWSMFPPYTTSIDAIRAEVLKQSEGWQECFNTAMFMLFATRNASDKILYHQLTAEHWCQCFLEAWEKVQT
jgi:hypothetical protein